MTLQFSTTVRVLNGFPLEVTAIVCDNELEIISLRTLRGSRADFIEDKLSKRDWMEIRESLWEAFHEHQEA